MSAPVIADPEAVTMTYTNWRGETSVRRTIPVGIEFKSTDFHPEQQWILRGWCFDRNAWRDFALADCDFTRPTPAEDAA